MTQPYAEYTTDPLAIGALDIADQPPPRPPRAGSRRTLTAAARLVRNRRRLRHLPTRGQLRAMALWDGSEPCSYLLDPRVNYVPEPLDLGYERELGSHALCFTGNTSGGQRSELVVFSDGNAFDLFAWPRENLRPRQGAQTSPDREARR